MRSLCFNLFFYLWTAVVALFGVLLLPIPSAGPLRALLQNYGRGPGHVFNLGHGIRPGVDPDHVAAMVAAVHDLSPAYHAAI